MVFLPIYLSDAYTHVKKLIDDLSFGIILKLLFYNQALFTAIFTKA